MPSPDTQRIAVVGGGPGGLYAAALLKRLRPGREVTVWERNAPDDTFGFGVVLSDETLGGIEHADPAVYAALSEAFVRWDTIDVVHRGTTQTSGGHGFAALERRTLLRILHERCASLGVRLRFRTEAPPAAELAASHDLVVAADGVHSATREAHARHFRPTVTHHRNRYIWLAADFAFDAFRFEIAETGHGVMQLHAYPFALPSPGGRSPTGVRGPADGSGASTVIVEMRDEVWRAAGFDSCGTAESAERCAKVFADALGGRPLRSNKSSWLTFATVTNQHWSHGRTVLLGDAAHTAHFSIGSGTKLAVEDALALAACIEEQPDLPAALAAYEAERRPVVLSTQRAAAASLRWFEELPQYAHQPPRRFAFNLLTRSRRVTHDNLRLRDPGFTGAVEEEFGCPPGTPPMFTPLRLRGLELRNRVVVSPMDMYSAAADGVPGDFHLVHLGARALGGAGLVMTEMVCVSPEGRITPGCTGLWTDEQADAWTRITRFVHDSGHGAAIGVQLGHSGRKGSTRRMWEGIDQPLDDGNWPVVAASPSRTRTVSARSRRRWTGTGWTRSATGSPRPPAAPPAADSTSSNCTAPTATCSPVSCPRSPTGAPTPTAGPWRTGCDSPWRSSTRSVPYGRGSGRRPYGSPRRTGSTAARATRTPWRSHAPSPPTGPTPSTSPPARSSRRSAPGTAARTRPRTPTASATSSACPSSRWAPSPPGTTSIRCCSPAGPTSAPWPAPTSTTRTGRCTRRQSRGTKGRVPPGRCRTARAAALRRPAAPTPPSPGSRLTDRQPCARRRAGPASGPPARRGGRPAPGVIPAPR